MSTCSCSFFSAYQWALFSTYVLLPLACTVPPAYGDEPRSQPATAESTDRGEARNRQYAKNLEAYLRQYLVDDYPKRAAKAWNRDDRTVEAFLASVEPNRRRWRTLLHPPVFPPSGPPQRAPYATSADPRIEWLTVPIGPIQADALLAMPESPAGRVPLVIAQHGLGGVPGQIFGFQDDGRIYHAYACRLVEAGFAVLAPLNLSTADERNRIERMCRLADTSLQGIELVRLQRLLDVVLADPRINGERVGMWGVSLGGLATLSWMPLEPRIKVGVVSAWFNDRCPKMVTPDNRYSCFLDSNEEHAFLGGWLTEFSDDDIVSLICPRPLLIQTGKKDPIAWWPAVLEVFKAAHRHYERLGLPDVMEMDLHEGGHETRVETGIRFLIRHLKSGNKG